MSEIKNFLRDNEEMTIEVSPGVSYNLRDVINESYRLYNAKFQESEVEESGFRRIFYRMAWVIFRTIVMASDIDLKDLNLRSMNGRAIKALALFKMAVHQHLSKTGFGKYVDQVMNETVWFGSSITKRVDGKVETVDLRNYATEPTIKSPQDRRHAEMCYYSYEEMLSYKEDWKDKWDYVETLWEKMQDQGVSRFKVIEFWTWGKVKEDDDETHKICIKYLDNEIVDWSYAEQPDDWEASVELERFKTPFKRRRTSKRMAKKLGEYEELFPYEQCDLFDAPGRWLAFGCGELLGGLSEHYNEYTNDKRKKDILDLKGLFLHKYSTNNNSLTQEYISNLDTHAVISLAEDEDFQRLVVDTKTSEYIANVDKLYEIMRLVMGVTAQGTGEELPASTSATQASLNAQTQQTTYDYVRERMHHFLVELFQNGYFEDILNELEEEELTAIVGDPKQLVELDKYHVGNLVNQWARDYKEQMGMYPSEEEYALVYNNLLQAHEEHGDMRFPELKKEIIKDADYIIEFYVTNEAFDKRSKMETLAGMKADPNSTKSKQAIEDAMLDLLNENPRQYDKTPEEKAAEIELMREQQMAQSQAVEAPAPLPPLNDGQLV